MTVISSEKNTETLSLTLVAEFDAPLARVWQVWEDPRQLERWWGPPTWPATFDRHDLTPGGESRYHMTGPEGEISRGWWKVVSVDAPNGFEFEDGFSDDTGEPTGDMAPIRGAVTLAETEGMTRMTLVSTFASVEQLDQLIAMGMQEGLTLAIGQIEDVLASPETEELGQV